jgi:hypothetical protein
MNKYHCTIDNGLGGARDVWAEDATAAIDEAMVWAEAGAWTSPAAFLVRVVNADDPEDDAETLMELDE